MNLSNREMEKIINQRTRQSPFFEKFNQLRYKSPKGYIEYDTVTFQIAKLLTTYQEADGPFLERDISHRFSLIILDQAYHQGFANFWLDKKLFDAFTKSHLPKTLLEIKRIVPVGLLFFPPKLKNPDGQYLKWIGFYYRLASENIPDLKLPKGIVRIAAQPEDSLSWFTILDDGSQYGNNQRLKFSDRQLEELSDEMYIAQTLQDDGSKIDTKSEKEFSEKVTELLIQTLLYLQLKPDELKTVKSEDSSRLSHRQPSKKQRLAPNIIGQDYHIKTDYEAQTSLQQRGSPFTHWRSGHWRHQPYGKRENPQYKTIWIEPTLIN